MENQESKPEVASPAPSPAKKVDTYSYKGWMNSDYFWKRTLSVYGYSAVGSLIISVVIVFMVVCLAIPLVLLAIVF